ncbi:MAG: hypothetical protein SXQ77_08325, partial [Halobacteria archaeon]|nr:hypothetical protein [Halobacteria archaeon]
ERGFIKTNEYLKTTAENVWAQGDIAGNCVEGECDDYGSAVYMFKHSADYETEIVVENALGDGKKAIDFTAMP